MPSDRDLDAVGLPSTSTVQDLLDNAEDPRKAISDFQEQNALLVIIYSTDHLHILLFLVAFFKTCSETVGTSRYSTSGISWIGKRLLKLFYFTR